MLLLMSALGGISGTPSLDTATKLSFAKGVEFADKGVWSNNPNI